MAGERLVIWYDFAAQIRDVIFLRDVFQNTMEVMGLIAILVNCALIGLSGQVHRMFPDISKTQTILLIVALEVSSEAQYIALTNFRN